jgi:acid stress-induced BolA-like protein IbaG/YrbA
MFGGFPKEEMSDIEKIKRQNEVKFNIDDILDRITSVGIENLTPEEKRFLDSYNNE